MAVPMNATTAAVPQARAGQLDTGTDRTRAILPTPVVDIAHERDQFQVTVAPRDVRSMLERLADVLHDKPMLAMQLMTVIHCRPTGLLGEAARADALDALAEHPSLAEALTETYDETEFFALREEIDAVKTDPCDRCGWFADCDHRW